VSQSQINKAVGHGQGTSVSPKSIVQPAENMTKKQYNSLPNAPVIKNVYSPKKFGGGGGGSGKVFMNKVGVCYLMCSLICLLLLHLSYSFFWLQTKQKPQLCTFNIEGNCRYGISCRNIHGFACEICGQNCLLPSDPQQNKGS